MAQGYWELPGFEKAFQVEAVRRKENKEKYWALPASERNYYTISVDAPRKPYLLLGIHHPHLNISSIAKVSTDEKKMGTHCLKFFLESFLLKELRTNYPGRNLLHAVASTEGGRNLFKRLATDLPNGITAIMLSDNYHQITIEYEP